MTVIDVNIFLYAYNKDASQHAEAFRWLSSLLASGESIGLPWVTIWAFLRISTNARIWDNPFSAKQAFGIMDEWVAQFAVILLQPGPRHLQILKALVANHRATGPMMTDAVLAALAIENGALLASTDQDFSRFNGLRWVNPLSK